MLGLLRLSLSGVVSRKSWLDQPRVVSDLLHRDRVNSVINIGDVRVINIFGS